MSYHRDLKISRYATGQRDPIEVTGLGLGTWRCTRENKKVKVRRVAA